MRKLLLLAFVFTMLTVQTITGAQTTRFLGIPVDGPKSEMVQKLIEKVYNYHADEDYFTGFYFGSPVYLFIQTVNGKVSRVVVYDIPQRSEDEIRDRFNLVYDKFKMSSRYTQYQSDTKIAEKESIARKMRQHKKLYKAVFNQVKEEPANPQNIVLASQAPEEGETINERLLNDDYTERRRRIHAKALAHINEHVVESNETNLNKVWFAISEKFGKFALILFYDNIANLLDEERLVYNEY